MKDKVYRFSYDKLGNFYIYTEKGVLKNMQLVDTTALEYIDGNYGILAGKLVTKENDKQWYYVNNDQLKDKVVNIYTVSSDEVFVSTLSGLYRYVKSLNYVANISKLINLKNAIVTLIKPLGLDFLVGTTDGIRILRRF